MKKKKGKKMNKLGIREILLTALLGLCLVCVGLGAEPADAVYKRVTNTAGEMYWTAASGSFLNDSANATVLSMTVFKNGIEQTVPEQSTRILGSTYGNIALTCIGTLTTGDIVQLRIKTDDGDDVTAEKITFVVSAAY